MSHDERTMLYAIGLPPTNTERQCQLSIDQPAADHAIEFGNLYGINSTCMEVIDEPHPIRERPVFAAPILVVGFLASFVFFVYVSSSLFALNRHTGHPNTADDIIETLLLMLVLFAIFTSMAFTFKNSFFLDAFTLKRRPIRFNRKTKKIYAIRHNGKDGVIEVPWHDDKDVMFCISMAEYTRPGPAQKYLVARRPPARNASYDIRCYKLDKAGCITHAFAIGDSCTEPRRLLYQWEYYRRYMQDGVEALPTPNGYWMKHETLKEMFHITGGWVVFSLMMVISLIVLAFMGILEGGGISNWGIIPLMLTPLIGSLGGVIARWIGITTSKEPLWPEEIEKVCQPDPHDPHIHPAPDEKVGYRYISPVEVPNSLVLGRSFDGPPPEDKLERLNLLLLEKPPHAPSKKEKKNES